jgi:hypothetical protein
MRLSDFEDEKALDVLADLIDPVVDIMSDEKIKEYAQSGNKAKAIKMAIKNHKRSAIDICAILDDKDPKEYHVNLFTLPMKLLDILNDPDVIQLFQSQSQTVETASGSVTENTVENGN